MRILFFTNLFPTSREPARGMFCFQLARALAAHAELRAVVPLPWLAEGWLPSSLIPARYQDLTGVAPARVVDGIPATYPRYFFVPGALQSRHPAFMLHSLLGHVQALHVRHRFDLINAHWLYPDGVAATLLGERLGLPVVISGRGSDVNVYLQDPPRRRQILQAVDRAAAVTVVSEELKDRLVQAGAPASKITAIGNGVDTRRFHPRERAACRAELQLDPAARLVVYVGRLSEEKGPDVLLEAYRQMHTSGRLQAHDRLALVGGGRMREALARTLAEAGLSDVVRLVGPVTHDQVPLWLGAADLVCMPSHSEGHPNAAMEALASGRPLVASAVGALPRMLPPHCGQLVSPGQPSQLADALFQALHSDWNEAEIAAQVQDQSWPACASRYLDLFRRSCPTA